MRERERRENLVDVVRAIEVGVIDEALPAHGGARLLEVDTHDDDQLWYVVCGMWDRPQSLRVSNYVIAPSVCVRVRVSK